MGNKLARFKTYSTEFDLDGRVPLKKALVLGMQHVLAMFVGNLTPILIVGGVCGFMPKLATILQIMPQSVLGGAALLMFASIIVSGIQMMTKDGIDSRTTTIIAVSLGIGYGLGSTAGVLSKLPAWVSTIFGESGIVSAAFTAIILNLLIPSKDNVTH